MSSKLMGRTGLFPQLCCINCLDQRFSDFLLKHPYKGGRINMIISFLESVQWGTAVQSSLLSVQTISYLLYLLYFFCLIKLWPVLLKKTCTWFFLTISPFVLKYTHTHTHTHTESKCIHLEVRRDILGHPNHHWIKYTTMLLKCSG